MNTLKIMKNILTEDNLFRKINSECGICQSENIKNYCHQCTKYFCEKCELTVPDMGVNGSEESVLEFFNSWKFEK